MPYGPKPQFRCREVTMLCKVNRRDHETLFRVWERHGLSGEDAERTTLYEGPDWALACDALTKATEMISEGLR
jgi:hypothetical protein